mgnify:CR=1 FL=1
MSRKNYKSDEKYRIAKALERIRYYTVPANAVSTIWSIEDDMFLLENNQLTAKELSELLGRSVKAIEHRRRKLRNCSIAKVALC